MRGKPALQQLARYKTATFVLVILRALESECAAVTLTAMKALAAVQLLLRAQPDKLKTMMTLIVDVSPQPAAREANYEKYNFH